MPVGVAVLPRDEPAFLHARQAVRQSALRPVQLLADLEHPRAAAGGLAERGDDFVVSRRRAAAVVELPVEVGVELCPLSAATDATYTARLAEPSG
jgi:hypothetical protein